MKKKRLFQLFGLFIIILTIEAPIYAQMMANVTSSFNEYTNEFTSAPIKSEITCALSIFCTTKSKTNKKVINSQSENITDSKNNSKQEASLSGMWQLCVENNGLCKWDIKDDLPSNVLGIEEVILMLRMSAGDLPYDFTRYINKKRKLGARVFNLQNGVVSVKILNGRRGETSVFIDVKRNLLLGINEYNVRNILTRKLICDYRQGKANMTQLSSASFQNYSYERNSVVLSETVTQFFDFSVDRSERKVEVKNEKKTKY